MYKINQYAAASFQKLENEEEPEELDEEVGQPVDSQTNRSI